MKEFTTRFLEKIERTPTAKSYRFDMPKELDYIPGQYMLLDLGDELVHPLSLSDCPEENDFIEFTKRMTGSPFCQKLESLDKNEPVIVNGPSGKFICEESGMTIVMIAGGIGITPIRSILKSHEKKGDGSFRIILIYGNQNNKDIAFREELGTITLPDYRVVHVLSDTTGMETAYQGFINAGIIKKEVPDFSNAIYMVSGPPVMVEAMKKEIGSLDVPDERIRTDVFIGYD